MRSLMILLGLMSIFDARDSIGGDTVRVYVLAGQSNMEGKAKNSLWDYQATAEPTREVFAHLRADDQWIERDDVFIKFLNRHGPLTLGYGSQGRSGAEYEFGYAMGQHHDDPVLLIKAAWGGHSLYKLFRSPSNPVSQTRLEEDLSRQQEQIRKRNEKRNEDQPLPTLEQVRGEYGSSYRNMISEVKEVKQNFETLFPALAGKTLKLSGVFWFQGWNDQYNGAELEYAANMQHFIKDVRRDLESPDLPLVIAVMGQNMSKEPKGAMKAIQDAQLSMESVPELKHSVRAVRTDVLVDKAAEALYPSWREKMEQWERTGSDHAYHYLGSAIWFTRIGRECAKAMIELENLGG